VASGHGSPVASPCTSGVLGQAITGHLEQEWREVHARQSRRGEHLAHSKQCVAGAAPDLEDVARALARDRAGERGVNPAFGRDVVDAANDGVVQRRAATGEVAFWEEMPAVEVPGRVLHVFRGQGRRRCVSEARFDALVLHRLQHASKPIPRRRFGRRAVRP
jgi:hypothetical protein